MISAARLCTGLVLDGICQNWKTQEERVSIVQYFVVKLYFDFWDLLRCLIINQIFFSKIGLYQGRPIQRIALAAQWKGTIQYIFWKTYNSTPPRKT